jgi:hypothetical protein
MVFNRPKRMMSPRAAARRIAQVSVEKEVRVLLGVDMEKTPLRESSEHTMEHVSCKIKFLEEGVQRRKD